MEGPSGYAVFLRPLGLDDADSLARNANDREISDNMLPRGSFPYPYTKGDAMGFIEASGNALIDGTMLNFAVCLSGTGELVGSCGIRNIDAARRECEIGYWIGRAHRGMGYGKEAVRLLIGVAFGDIGMELVRATVLPGNTRSLKLLQSLGFTWSSRMAGSPEAISMVLSLKNFGARSGKPVAPRLYG